MSRMGDEVTKMKTSTYQVVGKGPGISLPPMQAVSASYENAASIDDQGRLYVWGDNTTYQVGDGTAFDADYPVRLSQIDVSQNSLFGKRVASVSCGYRSTMCITASDGHLHGWGLNFFDTLAILPGAPGMVAKDRTKPLDLSASEYSGVQGRKFARVSVKRHALAIDNAGKLLAWGDNEYEKVGPQADLGASTATPYQVPIPGDPEMVQGAAGLHHSLALDAQGAVYAWGRNAGGALGQGQDDVALTGSAAPLKVDGGVLAGQTVSAITAGDELSGAIFGNGRVAMWGAGGEGELGDGMATTTSSPVEAILPEPVTALSAYARHVMAVGVSGKLYGWGRNNDGQVGDGKGFDRYQPFCVSEVPGLDPLHGKVVTSVATGKYHTVATVEGGDMYAWGEADDGRLGLGGLRGDQYRPRLVANRFRVERVAE